MRALAEVTFSIYALGVLLYACSDEPHSVADVVAWPIAAYHEITDETME